MSWPEELKDQLSQRARLVELQRGLEECVERVETFPQLVGPEQRPLGRGEYLLQRLERHLGKARHTRRRQLVP